MSAPMSPAPLPPLAHRSLVEQLRARAAFEADRDCVGFEDADGSTARWSYAALDRRARALAAEVQQICAPGDRVLLLLPPGLEYVAAFYACLYAGAVVVPAYPPNRSRLARSLPRIEAILRDARPAAVLADSAVRQHVDEFAAASPGLGALRWLACDEVPDERAGDWRERAADPEDLAFLQYTSGSTAVPKGVMVSHENLLRNGDAIAHLFGLDSDTVGVIWLPPYHDMGLIGGILQPVHSRYPVTLMAPATFARDPMRWLDAISRHGATLSGGPDFSYELAARRITDEQIRTLRLDTWRVASNGAEPIHADVLERFAERFAPAGFRPAMFMPCYGLAESTLIVTGARLGEAPVVRPPVEGVPGGLPLVGTGRSAPGERVAVVDPATRLAAAPGTEGEIWVSGPSVARGYWGRPEQTAETFGAQLADEPGPRFLRTGDLGLLEDGELFVTGRSKDLLVIRGVNHHPQDIEDTVRKAHPALAAGGGAAFTIEHDGAEQLVVVQEAVAGVGLNADALAEAIATASEAARSAVTREHEVGLHDLVLLDRRGLPRTSSGKVQRYAARDAYLSGSWSAPVLTGPAPSAGAVAERDAGPDPATAARADRVARAEWAMRRAVAERAGAMPDVLTRDVVALGLDSLAILELSHRVELELGVHVPADEFYNASLAEVAVRVADIVPADVAESAPADTDGHARLSHGQRALWFIEKLGGTAANASGSSSAENSSVDSEGAYNLCCAVRLPVGVDLDRLDRAVAELGRSHPILRAAFSSVGGDPRQRTGAGPEIQLAHDVVDDPALWTRDAVAAWAGEAASAPFALIDGDVLRVRLRRGAGQAPMLLLAVHHIVADLWSLTLLLEELVESYAGAPLRAAGPDFAAFVAHQQRYLDGPRGRADEQFWLERLGGELPVLDLPTDRPRPSVQGYRGDGCAFTLHPDVAGRLRELASASGTTLFTVLLTGYQALLHRYTGQDDIVVGAPTTGRARAGFARTVGYLVNPVALRVGHRAADTFRDLLARTDTTVRGALAHADFPFPLVAERTRTARTPGRPPVFQTMLLFQQAPGEGGAGLGAVALGRDGVELGLDGLALVSQHVPQHAAQFELSLSVAESAAGELLGRFQYDRDLFDATTVAGLAADFETLLAGAVADPDRSVRTMPLLGTARRRQVLDEWNDTAAALPARPVSVTDALREQALRTPEAVALVHRNANTGYAELQRRADALAARLRDAGVRRGDRVAVCAGRSTDLVVGLLGVLAAGAAYVPLDPGYPPARLSMMLGDAEVAAVVTRAADEALVRPLVGGAVAGPPVLVVDAEQTADGADGTANTDAPSETSDRPTTDDVAYVLYTSGSTGRPKGVVVTHRNVLNFFAAMDEQVGCDDTDTVLAVTSVSFDISVLELLWTLARGARVVMAESIASAPHPSPARLRRAQRPLELSLFYFASADADADDGERYRLVLDGARFADQHGFRAVWTPERHFHEFGGLYPNPSVLSAAIAAVTTTIDVRAGSVVLPLHSSLRVAEEWALVDSISGGRAGVAFASGWHADDFAFFPDRYADRKQHMMTQIDEVRRLWSGKSLRVRGGAGNEIEVRVHPRPVQATLPTWITAAGSPATFVRAGESGSNLLTHLLGQSVAQVASNIAAYRRARVDAGHHPDTGTVTLMLHTFVGDDPDEIRETVRGPFTEYLRSSVGLIENFLRSTGNPLDLAALSEADMAALLDHAFERYYRDSALFATPDAAVRMLHELQDAGVDEVACLIDFGLSATDVRDHLPALGAVRERAARREDVPPTEPAAAPSDDATPATLLRRYRPTLLQSTPSLITVLTADPNVKDALGGLRTLLLGGEALPGGLAESLRGAGVSRLLNMYGPTETTVWSTVYDTAVAPDGLPATVPLGFPVRNTRAYVLGPGLEPVPPGVTGELVLAGAGVTRGYWRRPGLTAAAFVPDPYGPPGSRMYRTGDLARRTRSGLLEFLGRADRQVKVRGHRVELAEIEAVLARHPEVAECVVTADTATPGDVRLVAFVVPAGEAPAAPTRSGAGNDPVLRAVATELPAWTVPTEIVRLAALPLTANGKIDVAKLLRPGASTGAGQAPPTTELERTIAGIWTRVLRTDAVGVHDNFFDVGGHSLLMAQVHEQLRAALDCPLALVELFEFPTIRSLADHLAVASGPTTAAGAPAGGPDTTAAAPGALDDSVARARRQRAARRGASLLREGAPQ